MVKMQNFDISLQTLQKMLRQGLTLQILNQTNHDGICWIKSKTNISIQKTTTIKIKMQKTQKNVIKIKLKFQDNKNCLKTFQIENKINHSEKK